MSVWFVWCIGLQVMQLSLQPTSTPRSEGQVVVVESL